MLFKLDKYFDPQSCGDAEWVEWFWNGYFPEEAVVIDEKTKFSYGWVGVSTGNEEPEWPECLYGVVQHAFDEDEGVKAAAIIWLPPEGVVSTEEAKMQCIHKMDAMATEYRQTGRSFEPLVGLVRVQRKRTK